jgi:hypothetical protein
MRRSRKVCACLLFATLTLASGCALRAPQYSPELGGFPMYKGSYGDRARLHPHDIGYHESSTKSDHGRSESSDRAQASYP